MRTLRQLARLLRILGRARRNRTDVLRALARRPLLLLGTAGYGLGTELSARVDPHLKLLAELKVAPLAHCAYCIDIGPRSPATAACRRSSSAPCTATPLKAVVVGLTG